MPPDPSPRPTERSAGPADELGAWRRALGLFAVVLATSVAQPTALVAAPFLILVALGGVRGSMAFFAAVLAGIVVLGGPRDGAWFAERAWALMVGGVFVGLSLARPAWRLTSRALLAVVTAVAASVVFMLVRGGAWGTVDWMVTDQLMGAYATWIDLMTVARQGEPVSPALAGAIYRTVEMQVAVFPALLALESMAAVAVAWWLFVRLSAGEDRGIGPLGRFRFNDHLVWVMIAGLLLVTLRAGDAVSRIGANLAVFMGALYALRGMGVVMFVSGGLSFFGYLMFFLGLLLAAPVVIGFSVLFGIADTWLDLRKRVGSVQT